MWKANILKSLKLLSLWLFWPGVLLIVWGELTPNPPDLSAVLGWDKAQHFIAYFGLAAMATTVIGLSRRLLWAIGGIILLGGMLEILQGYTGRDPDIFDVIANSIGACCGTLTALLVQLVLKRPQLVAGRAPE